MEAFCRHYTKVTVKAGEMFLTVKQKFELCFFVAIFMIERLINKISKY